MTRRILTLHAGLTATSLLLWTETASRAIASPPNAANLAAQSASFWAGPMSYMDRSWADGEKG